MKLKEKFQRFWTLSGSRQGFTLVELIVVIAILAILAGVAIPVYNGYIKKAQSAADQQLLDTINTAFAAACMENGTSQYEIESNKAKMPLSDGKVVLDGVQPAALQEAFAFYFGGNENASFETITELKYDSTYGMFVDAGPAVSFKYGDTNIVISQSTLDALRGSTFGTIGTENLLGKLDSLTTWAGTTEAEIFALLGDAGDDYYSSLAGYLGFEEEELDGWLGTLSGDEVNTIYRNGLVLYAADKTSGMSAESIQGILNSDDIYGTISKSEDTATVLAQASVVYGLYTAYTGGTASDDPITAIQSITGEEKENFTKYVNSDQGKADLEAYMTAMDVLKNSSDNSEAVQNILTGSYSENTDLSALLQSIIGK